MADIILGIESSCDDTSAAVLRDGVLLSNVIASQQVHKDFGGVVPELASRAHEQNIVPVVSEALRKAGVKPEELTAIAFTRGPGLLGSLLVGTSFAKALSLSLDIPMVMVNHLQGHILANFIRQADKPVDEPSFPYLCLLVSGGNSQIVKVTSPLEYEILGQTIDDAVGEAFDKCSKMLGLGYPGGPVIDRLAKLGNPDRFHFAKPNIPGLDYSFSGIKTSLLYKLRDLSAGQGTALSPQQLADIAASYQYAVVDVLARKAMAAAKAFRVRTLVAAGGVACNAELRRVLAERLPKGVELLIAPPKYCTDNAAMVGGCGWHDFRRGAFSALDIDAFARLPAISRVPFI